MKFGIFYEHQLPKVWKKLLEQQLFQDALAQIELANKLSIDYAWEVEDHFLKSIHTLNHLKYSWRQCLSEQKHPY